MALILSLYLTSDVTSDMILALIGGTADFEVSDFYNRVDAGRHEKSLNKDIVVVNIDDVNPRDSIAMIIERIADSKPAVIGVDVLCREPKDTAGDSLLIHVLRSNSEKIVTAIALRGNGEEDFTYIDDSIFLDSIPAESLGVVNLAARHGGIVRSFFPYFRSSTETLPAFATLVASLYSPAAAEKLLRKENDELKLRYSNEEFMCIKPQSVFAGKTDLKDKIVLVGTQNDPLDLHPTPIRPAYPGVLIQAQIISSILAGDYISTADGLLNTSIAVIISFLLCMVYVSNVSNNAQNLILRLSLIAVMAAGVLTGCVLYSKFNVYVNIVMILLVVALSQFILDIWYGIGEIVSGLGKSGRHGDSKVAPLVFLFVSSGSLAYAADRDIYTVFDIDGTVIRLNTGQPLSKGSDIGALEMLGMRKNRELTLYDSSNGKLYVSVSQENTTAEKIIQAARSQSKSLMKRVYSEMLANVRRRDNRRNASKGINIGATERDNGEELNVNTEHVFSFLTSLLSSGNVSADICPDTIAADMTAHEVSADVIWWSIRNNSSIPLYVNILQLPQGNCPPAFIYESDVEMPSLLIAPGKELNLTDQLFICSNRKYLLVASDSPFDCEDINTYFADGEEPVDPNDQDAKGIRVFTFTAGFPPPDH